MLRISNELLRTNEPIFFLLRNMTLRYKCLINCQHIIIIRKFFIAKVIKLFYCKSMRNRKCLNCGKVTTHYKYCGSYKDKTGCAYTVNVERVRLNCRGYNQDPKLIERRNAYYAKWYKTSGRKRNAIAQKAQNAVAGAIRRGKLTRPEECSSCTVSADEMRIEAHHPDYGKVLEVEWLCQICHQAKHRPI